MNNKIKELAVNAGMNFDGFGEPILGALDSGSEFLEKFAELVVNECASVIELRVKTCGDVLDSKKANQYVKESQLECAKTIKSHFGMIPIME